MNVRYVRMGDNVIFIHEWYCVTLIGNASACRFTAQSGTAAAGDRPAAAVDHRTAAGKIHRPLMEGDRGGRNNGSVKKPVYPFDTDLW